MPTYTNTLLICWWSMNFSFHFTHFTSHLVPFRPPCVDLFYQQLESKKISIFWPRLNETSVFQPSWLSAKARNSFAGFNVTNIFSPIFCTSHICIFPHFIFCTSKNSLFSNPSCTKMFERKKYLKRGTHWTFEFVDVCTNLMRRKWAIYLKETLARLFSFVCNLIRNWTIANICKKQSSSNLPPPFQFWN